MKPDNTVQLVHIPIKDDRDIAPGFDANFPSDVRRDPNISWFSKVLYAEIRALCTEQGFCWAKNKFFQKIFGVDARTIQRGLKELADNNYISITKAKNDVDGKIYRILRIAGSKIQSENPSENSEEKNATNMSQKTRQKCRKKRDKNVTQGNNINLNNININKRACARIPQQNSKSKAQFHNFSQRDYDYDALEDAMFLKQRSGSG